MLVLTRKPQEVIQIGPNVKITIVRVSGQTVRIGIDAPQDVHVIRGELAFEDPSEEERRMARRQSPSQSSKHSRTAAILRRMKSLTDPPHQSLSGNADSSQRVAEVLNRGPRFTDDDVTADTRWRD